MGFWVSGLDIFSTKFTPVSAALLPRTMCGVHPHVRDPIAQCPLQNDATPDTDLTEMSMRILGDDQGVSPLAIDIALRLKENFQRKIYTMLHSQPLSLSLSTEFKNMVLCIERFR